MERFDRRWSRWQAENHPWTSFYFAIGTLWACASLFDILVLETPLLSFRAAWPPITAAFWLGFGICSIAAVNRSRFAKVVFACCHIALAALVLLVSAHFLRLLGIL